MSKAYKFWISATIVLLPLLLQARNISFQVPEYRFKNEVLQQQFANAIEKLSKKPTDNFDICYMSEPDTMWTRTGWNIEEQLYNLQIVTHHLAYYPERDRHFGEWVIGCCRIGKHTLYLYDTVTVRKLFSSLNTKYTVSYATPDFIMLGLEEPNLFFLSESDSLHRVNGSPYDYCYNLFTAKRDFNDQSFYHPSSEAVGSDTTRPLGEAHRAITEAEFPGGVSELRKQIWHCLQLPDCDSLKKPDNLQMYLTIEPDGRISDVQLAHPKYNECYLEELKRAAAQIPPFYPAVKRDQFVRSRYFFILW